MMPGVQLFNLSSRFYKKGTKLIIIVNDLSLSMVFSDNLYDFLVYLMEKIYIDDIVILKKTYNISEKIIQLFQKIGLLIQSSDTLGKEAMWFHGIIQNPSLTNFPDQMNSANLDLIYKNIPNYFYSSFDQTSYSKYEKHIKSGKYEIQRTHSSRAPIPLSSSSKVVDLATVLMILRDLFLLRESDGLFYGSGGGFYSVYPVLITRADEVYVYDKYQETFYSRKTSGVFNDMIECYLYSEGNDFSRYDFHIIFVSAYQGVFNKYGNRGYRYIQMEAGAIGGLLRQMLRTYNIGQLEIQGYNDLKLIQLLESHVQINSHRIMLLHTLACK